MREATKGENFDEIIKGEFYEIEPIEARFIASCVALTTEAGFTVSKQDLISFSDVSPSETLAFLERNLNDIILKAGSKEDRLVFRHRAIAEYIITNCLNQDSLRDIYLRILSSLAPEIDFHDWKSRKFALYKEIINHKNIYKRFQANIDNARALYESLITYFSGDYQFWLQYGSLETEGRGGSLELAENYLQQAASLKPKSQYVKNALANLYFKKSVSVKKISEAATYRNEANNILHEIFEDPTNEDAHSYHIYCAGNYNYIITNLTGKELVKAELEKLKAIIKQGVINNPVNKRLSKIKDVIDRAYLLTAAEGEISYPVILSDLD